MKEQVLTDIVNALYGLFLGSALPIIIIYLLVLYRKKRDSGFRLFFKMILRFLLISLIYLVINAVIIFSLRKYLLTAGNEYEALWGLFGLSVGFFGGIIMFIIGFRRGKRSASKT